MQVTLDKQKLKKMAQILKEFHANTAQPGTLSQAYEVLAALFEQKDWNTLSAKLQPNTPEKSAAGTNLKKIYFEVDSVDPRHGSPEYAAISVGPELLHFLKTNPAQSVVLDVSQAITLSWELIGLGTPPDLIKASLILENNGGKEKSLHFDVTVKEGKRYIDHQSYSFTLESITQIVENSQKGPELKISNGFKVLTWPQGTYISPGSGYAVKEHLSQSLAFMGLQEKDYQLALDLLEDMPDD